MTRGKNDRIRSDLFLIIYDHAPHFTFFQYEIGHMVTEADLTPEMEDGLPDILYDLRQLVGTNVWMRID